MAIFHSKENMSGAFLDKNRKEVRRRFSKVNYLGQLASLLIFIERAWEPELSNQKQISSRTLNYLSRAKDEKYWTFKIAKKSGDKRTILAPDNHLKRIQKLLNILFQTLYEDKFQYCNNGFILNRNIKTNANPHIGKNFVLNMDLEDFFPSINFRRVKTVLTLDPINFKDDKDRIAFVIANICCYNGFLPQGAPTSPILSNIVTQNLDRKLIRFCQKLKISYTRYADDLTFSSNKNFNQNIIEKITELIKSENFNINNSKTRIRSSMQRQVVTGITVNRKTNINRDYIKRVRAILKNWESSGENYTQIIFEKHYNKPIPNPNFINVLGGYINFIGLIRSKNDPIYQKLIQKFSFLKNRIDFKFITVSDIREKLILDNKKMELLFFQNFESEKEKFIAYCTHAFYQIESLVRYYYYHRFKGNMKGLYEHICANNRKYADRYKKYKPPSNFVNIINVEFIIYVFEKENYIDKKISYNREITWLRNIRNDNSHRSVIKNYDIKAIKEKYSSIEHVNKRYYSKHKRYRTLPSNEEDIKLKYNTILLVDSMNFNTVRVILYKVVELIKQYHIDIL